VAIIKNPISKTIDPALFKGVDRGIIDAIDVYYEHGISGGKCVDLLLQGSYDAAFEVVHELCKPTWQNHINYVKALPVRVTRQVLVDAWKAEYALLLIKQCHFPLDEALSNAEAMLDNMGGDFNCMTPADAVDEEIDAMRANC
jgi:hypothetical protein